MYWHSYSIYFSLKLSTLDKFMDNTIFLGIVLFNILLKLVRRSFAVFLSFSLPLGIKDLMSWYFLTSVFIVGSVPGRHMAEKKHWFGHMKLRKLLNENGPAKEQASKWPVVGQFSSIGSLGASKENWLSVEFLQSLATVKGTSSVPLAPVEFKLVCSF